MIVLGIDPGYERLGVAIVKKEIGVEELVFSDCLVSSASLPFAERLLCLAEGLEKVIKEYKPEVVAVERIFFTVNQKTAIKVAEIRGVVEYLAAKNKLEVAEYTPLEIKNCITGYGKATKDQVISFIGKLIKVNKKIQYDDEYDAIAAALTHLAHSRFSQLSTRKI